jgi:hypothetical protein
MPVLGSEVVAVAWQFDVVSSPTLGSAQIFGSFLMLMMMHLIIPNHSKYKAQAAVPAVFCHLISPYAHDASHHSKSFQI